MPFGTIKLNDDTKIPSIAFGTGSKHKQSDVTDYVEQALDAGFIHVDTAQYYGNEEYVGRGIRESGLSRNSLYITTKYGRGSITTISEAIKASLDKLGVEYVDLYLIHHPNVIDSMESAWKDFEKIKWEGLTKSIGVSNFQLSHMQELIKIAKIKPAVNQIALHPYNYEENKPLLEYCALHGVVVEAYSPLSSITKFPGGPVDKPIKDIANRLHATASQVIFAWLRSKNIVIVTTTSRRDRLNEYLEAGNLPDLTKEDIFAIENAALKGPSQSILNFVRLQSKRLSYKLLAMILLLFLVSFVLFVSNRDFL